MKKIIILIIALILIIGGYGILREKSKISEETGDEAPSTWSVHKTVRTIVGH